MPVRWQGWVVLAVYFALILGPAPFMHGRSPLYFLLYAFCLTMALGLVVAKKGEPLQVLPLTAQSFLDGSWRDKLN